MRRRVPWAVAVALVTVTGCNDDQSDARADAGADAGLDAAADTSPDAGQDSLDACFEGLVPRVETRTVNVLDFVSDDGSIHVRMAREVGERSAVGETFAYDLVRFGIEEAGQVDCVPAPGALQYTFGHHNWDEVAVATGARTWTVHMKYDFNAGAWSDDLVIDDGSPIVLTNTGCTSIPTVDLNHCLLRDSDD